MIMLGFRGPRRPWGALYALCGEANRVHLIKVRSRQEDKALLCSPVGQFMMVFVTPVEAVPVNRAIFIDTRCCTAARGLLSFTITALENPAHNRANNKSYLRD